MGIGGRDDVVEHLRLGWKLIKGPVVMPLLRVAVFVCTVMSVMLFVERVYMAAVIVCVKLLGKKRYTKYRKEIMREDLERSRSHPRVLIQIPMYNEKEVYKLSIGAAGEMSWPSDKLIIQVLDDSTNPEIVDMVEFECEKWLEKGVNIKYERRENRNGYKAGALREGLEKQYVKDCEFVAIFDADFQPEPDYLWRTIPFLLHNPDLALVQARWKFGAALSMALISDDHGLNTILYTLSVTCMNEFIFVLLPPNYENVSRSIHSCWINGNEALLIMTMPAEDPVNANECLMTRLQEMSLDYHFSVEQEVGSSTYSFFGFNGTAGVWRVQALMDAGGWKDRTTVEDMDLAVRASLKGWKFVFVGDLSVKNELPSTYKAYRYQQHRWSCGPANLFRKMSKEILCCEKVSFWKKLHVLYAFFFVRKIVAHWVTFFFYCIIIPACVLIQEVQLPKYIAIYIPFVITILNSICTPRSIHLLVFWILFENVMSLHRTKAAIIGLLEADRVNEWVVTEKLGNTLRNRSNASTSAVASTSTRTSDSVSTSTSARMRPQRRPRLKFIERIHVMELIMGVFLLYCAIYDVFLGRDYFFFYLFLQSAAFFVMGFGYMGTFVPSN